MNSFQSIAISKNTSLAVVAPGIAEALFATALGLLVAIPAVIAYNKISKDMDRYAARLDDFSSEFSAIISRQLEGAQLGMGVSVSQGSDRGRRRTRNRPHVGYQCHPVCRCHAGLAVGYFYGDCTAAHRRRASGSAKAAQTSVITETDEPLSVTIDLVGRVFLQDTKIPLNKLSARLIAVAGGQLDIRIFVRGDKTIDYGRVMQVMGTINAAGFRKVGTHHEITQTSSVPQKT